MKVFGIDSRGIMCIQPVGYLEFLEPGANARLVLTDSGGAQEEACILNVPCVTLRENTGRPETIDAGANVLAGTDADSIIEAVRTMTASSRTWKNPFGDGHAGERIAGFCAGIGR